MRDDAVSLAQEEEHLGLPIIRAQRPTVMKHKGLRISGTPILVKDFHAVVSRNSAHVLAPFESVVPVSASTNGAKMEDRAQDENFYIGRAVSDLSMSEPELPSSSPRTPVQLCDVRLWHKADIAIEAKNAR